MLSYVGTENFLVKHILPPLFHGSSLIMAPEPAKKRKKNAPDKPQPEWMFPDDDKNPALNPKPKSDAQVEKEKAEWEEAVKFLQYKSVTAPLKAPPPGLLLTLVGAFLTSYGFNSASRLYTTQLASRKKLEAWEFELGEKLPKGFPDLVKIFKEWHKDYQEKMPANETSSEEEDENDVHDLKMTNGKLRVENKTPAAIEDTSTSGSSDESSDESEAEVKSESVSPAKSPKKIKRSASSSVSSTSSSDSSDSSDSSSSSPTPFSGSTPTTTSKSNRKHSLSPAPPATKTPKNKRKRSPSPAPPTTTTTAPLTSKKQRTPFQRVSKDTPVAPNLASNAYVAHDYGDRAHQDLSVTRGKGFTKEKNKKKRGSYRGGAIDVGGGKGVKFEE